MSEKRAVSIAERLRAAGAHMYVCTTRQVYIYGNILWNTVLCLYECVLFIYLFILLWNYYTGTLYL